MATLLSILGLLFSLAGCEPGRGPEINKRFPVEGDQLSPPMVATPIHECAEAVHVYGFIPHAHIRVYANGNELIGEAQPNFGFADIHLARALAVGEKISATQTVGSETSVHTHHPVVVSAYPAVSGGFNKPDVGDDLYECGRVVPVGNLIESVRVHVLANGTKVGEAESPGTWKAVWVQALQAGQKVTARQIACEDDPAKTITSPEADPVVVQSAPNPMPSPTVSTSGLVVGNDTVTLDNLLVGAHVTVLDNGSPVGGGYANGSGNWVPIAPPLSSSSHITATQELCGVVSPQSSPEQPSGELEAPTVLAPICRGQQHVILIDVVVNATVVVFRNNAIVGYGGGGSGDLVLSLGDGIQLNTGDVITARQYFGNAVVSPSSNSVTVTAGLVAPAVRVLGGHPFFLAEAGEQQIDGAVFPRGAGPGPVITVQSCCDKSVRVHLRDPKGSPVAEIPMVEIFPGYFRGRWNWMSESGWAVPHGIPVGTYQVRVTAGCDQRNVDQPFYVIFNPEDVSGPPRFSFNETGIWFGALQNGLKALHYYLHPDDVRVFRLALDAIQGETDSRPAAEKIADTEEAKFSYSLSYHGNDVLHMLTSQSSAQCADDADVLTALLRAVGIPAHPATADAALETGDADWTFDTWTEFLVPTSSGTEWLVLHPHEYPTMNPMRRNNFGGQPVATESFNDIIVFADTNWNWSETGDQATDASYKRNPCSEPEEHISKKNWVYEICEEYWAPKTHWGCGTTSSAAAVGAISLNLGDFALGRTFSGIFTLDNRDPQALTGELAMELAFDLPESKQFPDSIVHTDTSALDVPSRGRVERSFRFDVPKTAPVGMDFVVRARMGDRVFAVQWLQPENLIDVGVEFSEPTRVGVTRRIDVVVRNRSKRVLTDVFVTARAPLTVFLSKESPIRISALQPSEEDTLHIDARFLAPEESGAIVVDVGSADGGWARATRLFTVPDERLNVTPVPIVPEPR